jgi:hypothetical protein
MNDFFLSSCKVLVHAVWGIRFAGSGAQETYTLNLLEKERFCSRCTDLWQNRFSPPAHSAHFAHKRYKRKTPVKKLHRGG